MPIGPTTLSGISRESLPCLNLGGAAGYGGPIVVLNEVSTVQTVNFGDPYSILVGGDGTHASVRPLACSGYGQSLQIYHVYDTAPTTPPQVRVYGECFTKEPVSSRLQPFDVIPADYADVSSDGFWVPLIGKVGDTGTSTWTADYVLTNVDGIDAASVSPSFFVNVPIRMELTGFKRIMVVISVLSTGLIGNGMIVGRLVG